MTKDAEVQSIGEIHSGRIAIKDLINSKGERL